MIPDSLKDAEINIGVDMPQPEIRMEKRKDGSISLSAYYDMCDISEFALSVANELHDYIEKALIEDLLELNGYIKEITCTFSVYKTGDEHYPTCSVCGYEAAREECEDYVGVVYYEKRFCPNCGAKVIQE